MDVPRPVSDSSKIYSRNLLFPISASPFWDSPSLSDSYSCLHTLPSSSSSQKQCGFLLEFSTLCGLPILAGPQSGKVNPGQQPLPVPTHLQNLPVFVHSADPSGNCFHFVFVFPLYFVQCLWLLSVGVYLAIWEAVHFNLLVSPIVLWFL